MNKEGGGEKQKSAAAAQAARLARLAEPKPRVDVEPEEVRLPQKKKKKPVGRLAALQQSSAGMLTPKGPATKTTAEIRREKEEAAEAERKAERKAEAWKRRRAREKARQAAASAGVAVAPKKGSDIPKTKPAAKKGEPPEENKTKEKKNKRIQGENGGSTKALEAPPKEQAKREQQQQEKSATVDTGEIDLGLSASGKSANADNDDDESSRQQQPDSRRRGYLDDTSDSYSEDSDEDYIHSIRSPALSETASGQTPKLSLVAPPPAVVHPRPILSSMSLGFPGGGGETTKGGVLFATARFGARQAELMGVDAVLCDPEDAACDGALANAATLKGCVAVVRRGVCSFAQKARRAQAAGAVALFVVNSDDALFVVDGEGSNEEGDISIPVVMAGDTESFRLLAQLRAVAEAQQESTESYGANFAPLVSFSYDLSGPDGGGEAYSDLQVAAASRVLTVADKTDSAGGIDWSVHMEGFGSRDERGLLWVDGGGLMEALSCAFGWRATDDEIDELLEA